MLICICLIVSLNGYAQKLTKNDLIGIWQVSTSKTGSALLANYKFYNDNKFVYTLSGYDNMGRIRRLEGSFLLKGNKIILSIKYTYEIIGGEFKQGAEGFQKEEIVLDGGKYTKIPYSIKKPIELEIVPCKVKPSVSCMKLQNNTYYKISKDPNSEE